MQNAHGIILKPLLSFHVGLKETAVQRSKHPDKGHAATERQDTGPRPNVSDPKVWVPWYHITSIFLTSQTLIKMTLLPTDHA